MFGFAFCFQLHFQKHPSFRLFTFLLLFTFLFSFCLHSFPAFPACFILHHASVAALPLRWAKQRTSCQSFCKSLDPDLSMANKAHNIVSSRSAWLKPKVRYIYIYRFMFYGLEVFFVLYCGFSKSKTHHLA